MLSACGRVGYASLDASALEGGNADGGAPLDAAIRDAVAADGPVVDAGQPPWPTLDGQWTWMSGSDIGRQPGVYNTAGVAEPGSVPGARDNGGSAVSGGAFWLFGGYAIDEAGSGGRINDLWRYEPSTGLWTFVRGSRAIGSSGSFGTRGVSAPTNDPSARNDSAMWADATDGVWLFGGTGSACEGALNDLWRYRASTNEWTWMHGRATCDQPGIYGARGVAAPSNEPGGRDSSLVWTDEASNAWLYGGAGFDGAGAIGPLGDLWRHDAVLNAWTWVAGSESVDEVPVYGARGVPSATSRPGARYAACGWSAPGELWLFGGGAMDGRRSDLWRYTISTGFWTWIAGPSTVVAPGTYGERGLAAPGNNPGARLGCTAWRDAMGHFWLFGGRGIDSAGADGSLGDLWMFDPATLAWTWVSGSDRRDQSGVYGTVGEPDPMNRPGGRNLGSSWRDDDGSLWLFGGDNAYDAAASVLQLNDLWRFGPP